MYLMMVCKTFLEARMIFKEGAPLYATEIERKQGEDTLYINFLNASFVPNLADHPDVMARTIDLLIENPGISRMVFVQQRNYHYPFEQISLLAEIARIYNYMTKQENILSLAKLNFFGNTQEAYGELSNFLLLMKRDPIECYVQLKRRAAGIRGEVNSGRLTGGKENYMLFLDRLISMMEQTKLIKNFIPKIGDYSSGRESYYNIFRPDILPNFTFTRLVAQLPTDAELVDQYEITSDFESSTVTILKKKDEAKYFYHLAPPEYTLNEDHNMLLNLARNVLIEHRPKAEEFTDPEKTRNVFFNVAKDLLNELSQHKKIALNYR